MRHGPGAKALQQLYDLEPKTCCSWGPKDLSLVDGSPEPRDLAQEVLTAAENWPVDEDGINPELDPGSAGVNLGLDAKDRFYGRMSGVEVEKELIRLAVLLQSLLRDFGLMKDTFGHLQDEQHSVKELMLQNSSACTAQVVDLQKEVEDKMKWLSAQVVDGTWTVAQCQKDTSAKCQVLREELDGKLESHKHNFEDFREEAGRRFDSSSQSLEEGLERLTERMDCNEQARKALRIDAFNEMAHARQAAHDLRQSDQEQMNKKFSAMQAVQESMQQACCTVEGKVDAAWEALQDVQEKIVIVSEENVSKFVLAENGVAEVQQKVNEVHEETTRGRLATEVVIDELQKELLAVKKAGSSLLTSEFSRDESQPGHVAGLGDFQVSHMSRASSEMPITLTQSSNEERLDVLELQVQRTAENQKILEEELFERLKEFELQARRTPEGPEGPDISERLDYFDHQVHLAAQSQRSLAEDLFQRLDELEQQVHSSYNQELLELLENLEIQAPRSAGGATGWGKARGARKRSATAPGEFWCVQKDPTWSRGV
ncbi:unnamed protein product [Cladocopium goreaui]|uniref:Uncharacterized protein n=1 Tax=Cladocopium goreaui TaxID=2562237 RepID=A0A9P1DLP5_9DINO|nr:unnamed protein product [Cladocopium goreaui]